MARGWARRSAGTSRHSIAPQDAWAIARRTTVTGLEIVRSSAGLRAAEQTQKGECSLRVVRGIQGLSPDWGFVIIDCPPSLSYLSVGALMAVQEVIIPVEAHAMALPGVAAVIREMGRIQSTFNPGLRSPLIVACRVNRQRSMREQSSTTWNAPTGGARPERPSGKAFDSPRPRRSVFRSLPTPPRAVRPSTIGCSPTS